MDKRKQYKRAWISATRKLANRAKLSESDYNHHHTHEFNVDEIDCYATNTHFHYRAFHSRLSQILVVHHSIMTMALKVR